MPMLTESLESRIRIREFEHRRKILRIRAIPMSSTRPSRRRCDCSRLDLPRGCVALSNVSVCETAEVYLHHRESPAGFLLSGAALISEQQLVNGISGDA